MRESADWQREASFTSLQLADAKQKALSQANAVTKTVCHLSELLKRWGSIWTSVELRGETHIEIYIPLMFQTGRIYNDNRIYYKLVLEVWKLSRITELIVLFLISFPETHPSNIFTSKNYWPPVCFEVHLPWKQAVLWVVLTEMGWPLMWDTPDPFVHQTSEWPACRHLCLRGPNFLRGTL